VDERYVADGTADFLPGFDLNATAYALQEREGDRLGRRLGLVELEGCESGAFVDGVAEDERLLPPLSAFHVFSSTEVHHSSLCGNVPL
jgi:hypothetical protein